MEKRSAASIIAIILLVLMGIADVVGLVAIVGIFFDFDRFGETWINATRIGLFASTGNFVALIFAAIGHIRHKNKRTRRTLIAAIVLLYFSCFVAFAIIYGWALLVVKLFLTLLDALAALA